MPELVIFDLDGTLTRSKQALAPSMTRLLAELLARTKVAIISGGAFLQFAKQVVAELGDDADIENLYILPTSGAALYEWRARAWQKVYEERISENDAKHIEEAIRMVSQETGLVDFSTPSYGERIEYRGAQVTLSVLGQQAPLSEKEAWDPTKEKRHTLQSALAARLPGYTVTMGGKTSIDVTREGIDKAYGIHQLSKRLKIPESSMLYVGDELGAGGNDEAAYKTNVKTRAVAHPEETKELINELLVLG